MKTIDSIDYSSLDTDKADKAAYSKVSRNPLSTALFIVTVALSTVSWLMNNRSFTSFLLPVIFGCLIFIFFALHEEKKERDKQWIKFAEKNNWKIMDSISGMKLVPPSLDGVGEYIESSLVIEIELNGQEWHLFTYTTKDSSSKYAKLNYMTILHKKLSKNLPYIALNSNKNDGGIERVPYGCKQISLEGNFDKYFKLYIQKDSQIDVLSIITPDIMKTLIDKNLMQDIEIIDDNMFLIHINGFSLPNDIKNVITAADELFSDLNHRIRTLHYTSDNGKKSKDITAVTVRPLEYVEIPNWKTKILWLMVITFFVFALAGSVFLFNAVNALP